MYTLHVKNTQKPKVIALNYLIRFPFSHFCKRGEQVLKVIQLEIHIIYFVNRLKYSKHMFNTHKTNKIK